MLIGPSGSGKTHAGRLLAEYLGWEHIDTDSEIQDRIGMPIDEFFERFGEAAFRAIETETLRAACAAPNRVVSTGGGAVVAEENWAYMRPSSAIIALRASVETLVGRVDQQATRVGRSAARPLLAGDPTTRMAELLDVRNHLYAQADAVIDTDDLPVEVVVQQVGRVVRTVGEQGVAPVLSFVSTVERSDIYVWQGIRSKAGELARQRWPNARTAWVISDKQVAVHWLTEMTDLFAADGFDVRPIVVAPGEASKSLRVFGDVLDEMTAGRVSRRDIVVALGGGVVGDLAGFVASSCLRGLSLMQIPTSLLAMVDSSVGGKTGINTGAGKNLIGAFYQPGLVLIDPGFLMTLPQPEYRSGMAEVIKHSRIQPSTPVGGERLASMLATQRSVDPIDPLAIDDIVRENVRIKHSVVEADEREGGLRMILNFGHTAGHAIEADGYKYRHGEAVGLGMLVATQIAIRLDYCGGDRLDNLLEILDRAGLPTKFDGDADDVIENMKADKKNVDGFQRWILPDGPAGVEIRSGVPSDVVRESIEAIGGR